METAVGVIRLQIVSLPIENALADRTTSGRFGKRDPMKNALVLAAPVLIFASAALPATGDEMEPFLRDDRFVILEGTIGGKARVNMQLLLSLGGEDGNAIRGTYHYAAVGDAISLLGSIDGDEDFEMEEFMGHGSWETTGTFSGRWNREYGDDPAPLRMSGTWSSPDGKRQLPFLLEEVREDGIAPLKVYKFSEVYSLNGMERSQELHLLQVHGETPAIDAVNRRLRAWAMDWQAPMDEEATPRSPEHAPDLKELALAVRALLPTEEEKADLDLSFSDSLTFDDSMEISLNRRDLLSVSAQRYSFTGGAHGNSIAEHLTFDLETGKELTLDELLKPGWNEAVRALAEATLRRAYGLKPEDSLHEEGPLQVETLELNGNWHLTAEGLGFCYDPYEIAAYAVGFIHPVIRYRDLKDWIRPDAPLARMLAP